jgi:putative oxidoreductase
MFESRFLRIIDRIYGWFIGIGSNLQSLFLLYMRLVWGHQFFITGIAKLAHIDTFTQFFISLNLSHPVFTSYAVASLETIGGLCLFFGFISRLAAIPLIVIMISALSLAHSEAFIQLRFLFEPALLVRQPPYPFLLTSLLVFIFGPGRVSIDAWIKRWASKQPKY